MKEIIINDKNLTENDMESEVIRVKGLILNSNGKILIAHNNNTYQFPGGHVDGDESINECIVREIKEETGINLKVTEDPFMSIVTYNQNYFGTGKKVLSKIYYYRFFTDEEPNLEETEYDELELATDFNLFYVNFEDFDSFLEKNIESGELDENIGREMLYVFSEYNNIFGGAE
ncbi:MAG: NUDIX hydrolase [Bacilli bacterium]|nr:NUDIX hydrolase [Bacilli bacterium]